MNRPITSDDLVRDAAKAMGALYEGNPDYWVELIDDAKAALRSLGLPASVLIGLKTGALKTVPVDDELVDERDADGNYTASLFYEVEGRTPIVVEVKFNMGVSHTDNYTLYGELVDFDRAAATAARVDVDTLRQDLDDLIFEEHALWREMFDRHKKMDEQ